MDTWPAGGPTRKQFAAVFTAVLSQACEKRQALPRRGARSQSNQSILPCTLIPHSLATDHSKDTRGEACLLWALAACRLLPAATCWLRVLRAAVRAACPPACPSAPEEPVRLPTKAKSLDRALVASHRSDRQIAAVRTGRGLKSPNFERRGHSISVRRCVIRISAHSGQGDWSYGR